MTWLKIDDGFCQNPKVEPLTDRAFRLHITTLTLCARELTDGFVTAKNVKVALIQAGASRKHIDELVDAGLWLPIGGGAFQMKDYLEYNPTREKVLAERQKARDRMKRVRGSEERSGEHTGERSGTPSRPGTSKSKTSAGGRYRLTHHDVPRPLSRVIDFAAEAARAQAVRAERLGDDA